MDDVTKAAERLRRMRDESNSCDGGYPATEEGRWQSLCDHTVLAEAWLADHDPTPIDEAWLRSVGFKDKTYQDDTKLAYSLPSPLVDSQWIEATPGMPSLFLLCRFSPMYDDDTPPDRFQVVVETRGAMRRLLTDLGVPVVKATP